MTNKEIFTTICDSVGLTNNNNHFALNKITNNDNILSIFLVVVNKNVLANTVLKINITPYDLDVYVISDNATKHILKLYLPVDFVLKDFLDYIKSISCKYLPFYLHVNDLLTKELAFYIGLNNIDYDIHFQKLDLTNSHVTYVLSGNFVLNDYMFEIIINTAELSAKAIFHKNMTNVKYFNHTFKNKEEFELFKKY